MKPEQFPDDIRPHLIPEPTGEMVYRCLECGAEFDITQLLYTCPHCRGLFMLEDKNAGRLAQRPGAFWRRLFDYRRMLNLPALSRIFRYHQPIAPVIPLADIIYLGEGHTPQVAANPELRSEVGLAFYFKNDGQNPSASFKDRGMAAALSYLNFLVKQPGAGRVLSICASTGDTSASAALYSSYLGDKVASAVILPHGKVTPQQLAQPLGSGAQVLEIPGVFDDCMKVVETLADNYQVALLNSKNSWRIRGQESYAYEIAQWFDYDLRQKAVVAPIGNAGNITAIMQGFLRLHDLKIIDTLPRVIGVQSRHADPVFRYYLEPDKSKRVFVPVTVQPSVFPQELGLDLFERRLGGLPLCGTTPRLDWAPVRPPVGPAPVARWVPHWPGIPCPSSSPAIASCARPAATAPSTQHWTPFAVCWTGFRLWTYPACQAARSFQIPLRSWSTWRCSRGTMRAAASHWIAKPSPSKRTEPPS